MTVTRKRRWLQFSLKGMLVVMTLACAGLGWLAYERNEVRKRQDAIAAIEKLGGHLEFDEEQPFQSKWLGPLLGDKSAGEVTSVDLWGTQVTDAALVHLQGLTKLEGLGLLDAQVTDAGLVHLKGLSKLESLHLGDTTITDAGLVHLQGLTELQYLYLSRTHVMDAGLIHLKGRTKLERLDMDGTQVTDAGLVHLKELTGLQYLNLYGTQVTERGVSELQKSLPNVKIVR